jgi:hypothetical protein
MISAKDSLPIGEVLFEQGYGPLWIPCLKVGSGEVIA